MLSSSSSSMSALIFKRIADLEILSSDTGLKKNLKKDFQKNSNKKSFKKSNTCLYITIRLVQYLGFLHDYKFGFCHGPTTLLL